jgi:hypothetical protein
MTESCSLQHTTVFYISNNVGPVKHFLSRPIHSLKRVFSSACWVVFLVGLDDFGSLLI